MINSDQMTHTRYSKGYPNSHTNTQCSSLWRQRRGVFSQENWHKGAEYHPATDCPKNFASVATIRQWLWLALKKE